VKYDRNVEITAELYDILEEFRSKLVAAFVSHALLQIKR
jgi:hypothetical protein